MRSDRRTGEVRCAWTTTDVLPTDDWPTGLYLVNVALGRRRATRRRSSRCATIARASDVLYVASTATWQAYNGWGGRSLYDFNSHGATTLAATPRAVAISFDRPYDNAIAPSLNWPLRTELALVSWLERRRLRRSPTATTPASGARRRGSRSTARLVIGQHSEYWDAAARRAVEGALEQGVSVCALSSNTCFWKVRYGEGGRRLVCYKTIENGDAASDPVEPTTIWRAPEVDEPENELFGVMYIGDGDSDGLGFPLVLDRSDDPLLRHVFDGTDGDTLRLGEEHRRLGVGRPRRRTAASRTVCACSAPRPSTARTSGCAACPRATTVRFESDPASTVAAGRGAGVYHTVKGARQHSGYVGSQRPRAGRGLPARRRRAGVRRRDEPVGARARARVLPGGYRGAPSRGARLPALSQLTYNILGAMGARSRSLAAAPEIVA